MSSLFGNLPKKPESTPTSGAPSPAAPAFSGFSGFSGFSAPSAPKDTGKDAKPTTGSSLFGSPAGVTDASKDTSTGSTGGIFASAASPAPGIPSLFGNPPRKPESTPASGTSSTAAPSFSAFSGLSAPSAPKDAEKDGKSASATTSASGMPSLFGNLPKKPETTPASNTPSTATLPFPALSGFPAPSASKDTDKAAKPAAGGSLFGAPVGATDASKDSSKDATTNKDGTSTSSLFPAASNKVTETPRVSGISGPSSSSAVPTAPAPSAAAPTIPSVPAPSMLRGKTIEDIVNRWTTDLETHTREFSQFASEVAVWDQTLIENGNYISALYATILAAESTQTSLEQSLDHVEQQQRHLIDTLDQYEKSANEILRGPGGIMTSNEGLGLADSERDKSYALAANLYTQLDDLSRSITQMVESVNSLNLSGGPLQGSNSAEDAPQEDAISTIAGILNAHLSSLQWIDGSLTEMDSKIKDAERKIKDRGTTAGLRGEGINKSRSYGLATSRR